MGVVKFDLRKYKRFKREIAQGSTGPLKPVFQEWGIRYLTWTKRLYKKNAKGGGEWPGLKSISYRRATGTNLRTTKTGRKRKAKGQAKARERYKKGAGMVKILVDTGTLFGALSIGQPGNLFELIRKGVKVGFAGVRGHKGTSLTIKDIAIKHQKGDPSTNLPQRKILHEPDTRLKNQMMRDLKRGIEKLGHSL